MQQDSRRRNDRASPYANHTTTRQSAEPFLFRGDARRIGLGQMAQARDAMLILSWPHASSFDIAKPVRHPFSSSCRRTSSCRRRPEGGEI